MEVALAECDGQPAAVDGRRGRSDARGDGLKEAQRRGATVLYAATSEGQRTNQIVVTIEVHECERPERDGSVNAADLGMIQPANLLRRETVLANQKRPAEGCLRFVEREQVAIGDGSASEGVG